MKIVHVVLGKANPERLNGINRIAHELCSAQRELGLDAEVWGLTATPDGPTPPRPYPLRLFALGPWRFRVPAELDRALLELAPRAASEPAPAVFHLHGGFLPEFHAVARALYAHGLPWVVSPHGAYQQSALSRRKLVKSIYRRLFEQRLVNAARAVLVNAPSEAASLARWAPAARVVVAPNGVARAEHPSGFGRLAAARLSARPEGLVVAYAGRLETRHKGLDLLLEGFARFLSRGGSATLWLVGDGPDLAFLEDLARGFAIADHVCFHGPRFGADKQALLAAADVFVHTSRHEGMPMAVLEAAAAGLPLLVSAATNLAAFVRAHDAGRVLEVNDPAYIAAALADLSDLAAAGGLARLAANARAMVAAEFDWRDIAARLCAAYGVSQPTAVSSTAA